MKGAKGKGAARVSQEALKPNDRKVGKRKAATAKLDSGSKRQAKREKKAKKDPNKPKRPPSAFFVFLEEFRKTFKKENPNVTAVSAVGKAAGGKWKSMSPADGDEASDKSKSEVNDEDEASGEEEHQLEPEPEPEQDEDEEVEEDEDDEEDDDD
ncbi:High mobility group B protein 1 [Citrus sinensis]|uniref:High mobility group B protein 1 n=1 Tax=Citrus sinensis TaxID=2711 RepID=A0ACB8JV77_CITSI|nr:High mobility group B protein 1 [Citrus sinensis]